MRSPPELFGALALKASELVALLLQFAFILADAELCLPEAIHEENRRNITVAGVSMPVGIVEQGWESAMQISRIYAIIAQEVLGYCTTHTMWIPAGEAMYMMMGCANPRDRANPQCEGAVPGTSMPRAHVLLEVWSNTVDSRWLAKEYDTEQNK